MQLWNNILQKNRFYFSACSVNKKFYLFHVLVRIITFEALLSWTPTFYGPIFSLLLCFPPLYTFLHLLKWFFGLFSSCCLEPTLFQSFFVFLFNFLLFLVGILYLIIMVKSFSYSSDILAIFVPMSGCLKEHDMMQKKTTLLT